MTITEIIGTVGLVIAIGGFGWMIASLVLLEYVQRKKRREEIIAGIKARGYKIVDLDVCDECGIRYPEYASQDVGPFHKNSCSLHPDNIV